MLSWPPAMITSASPQRIAWLPRCTAFRPEPHTLLMVMAGTSSGRPAKIEVCRAVFWPAPAVSTWPRITSLIAPGSTPVSASRRRTTASPSLVAGTSASPP